MLLSSHILSEVDRLADRVTIIREGRAVESGTLTELRHLRRTHLRAEVSRPRDLNLVGVHDLRIQGALVACTVEPDMLSGVLSELARAGVRDLTCTPPTLEELFLDAYRGRTTPAGADR